MVSEKSNRQIQKPGKKEIDEEISWGNKGFEGLSHITGEASMKCICILLGACSETI